MIRSLIVHSPIDRNACSNNSSYITKSQYLPFQFKSGSEPAKTKDFLKQGSAKSY